MRTRVHPGQARFGERGYVGQRRVAPRARDCDRAQAAALDEGPRRADAGEVHLHLPGDHIGDRGARALVGNVDDVDAGDHLEELAGEMRGGAVAAGGIGERAGLRFCERDQLLHRLRRHRRMEDEDHRRGGEVNHRREVLQAVIDGEHRVAVRRRPRDELGADDAARAGPVLDDELLAERGAELGREDADENVGAAAGREWHDQADRPRRIILRGGAACERRR